MAGEIVEIVSSDDEFEERRPIGWNYQAITKNNNSKQSNTYNRPIPKSHRNSEDDIVIVELTPEKKNPSQNAAQITGVKIKQNGNHYPNSTSNSHVKSSTSDSDGRSCPLPKIKSRGMPSSSSRQEIKAFTRNTVQASMSSFLQAVPPDSKRKHPDDDQTGSHSDRKKVKLTCVSDQQNTEPNRNGGGPGVVDNIPVARKMIDKTSDAGGPGVSHHMDTGSEAHQKGESCKDDSDEASEKSKEVLCAFIKRWNKIKSGNDKNDKKIEDKIWKYYYLAHSSYVHSKKFLTTVELSLSRMSIDNIYVLIKDLLDNLKSYKDNPYKEKPQAGERPSTEETSEEPPEPQTEEEKKRAKKLLKIEKMMKKISEKIQELDEAEVDLDDDDNSSYLVQERLKAQFMKLDDYYCKMAQCSRSTGRPVERKFNYDGSRYPEINQRITAWINKHREFPDYQDVLNLVRKVTNDSLLPLRPETVRVQAQEIFRDVGKMLKERRESDDLYSIYSYAINDAPDPAVQDSELASILDRNAEIAQEKLTKVFQQFVEKETEQRENSDRKTAAGEDGTKSGKTTTTTTDDDTTEKESKASDVIIKDSDDNTRDTDDTVAYGEDLPRDEDDSMDGGSDGQAGNSSRQPEVASRAVAPVNGERELNQQPLSPIQQEELFFDKGAPDEHCQEDEDDKDEDLEQNEDSFQDEEDCSNDVPSEDASLPDIETSHEMMDGDGADDRLMEDHLAELMKQPTELELEEEEEEDDELENEQEELKLVACKQAANTNGSGSPNTHEPCQDKAHERASAKSVDSGDAAAPPPPIPRPAAAAAAAAAAQNTGNVGRDDNCPEADNETHVGKENRTPDKLSKSSLKTMEGIADTSKDETSVKRDQSSTTSLSPNKIRETSVLNSKERISLSPKKSEVSCSKGDCSSVSNEVQQSPDKSTQHSPSKSTLQSPDKSTQQSPSKSTPQSPDKSTQQSPGKSTQQSPGKSAQQSPDNSTQQSPGKSTQQSPGKSTQQSPDKSMQQSPGKLTQQSPGKSTQQSPDESTQQSPGKSTQQSPDESTQQSPGKSTQQSPGKSMQQSPSKETQQSPSKNELQSPSRNNPPTSPNPQSLGFKTTDSRDIALISPSITDMTRKEQINSRTPPKKPEFDELLTKNSSEHSNDCSLLEVSRPKLQRSTLSRVTPSVVIPDTTMNDEDDDIQCISSDEESTPVNGSYDSRTNRTPTVTSLVRIKHSVSLTKPKLSRSYISPPVYSSSVNRSLQSDGASPKLHGHNRSEYGSTQSPNRASRGNSPNRSLSKRRPSPSNHSRLTSPDLNHEEEANSAGRSNYSSIPGHSSHSRYGSPPGGVRRQPGHGALVSLSDTSSSQHVHDSRADGSYEHDLEAGNSSEEDVQLADSQPSDDEMEVVEEERAVVGNTSVFRAITQTKLCSSAVRASGSGGGSSRRRLVQHTTTTTTSVLQHTSFAPLPSNLDNYDDKPSSPELVELE